MARPVLGLAYLELPAAQSWIIVAPRYDKFLDAKSGYIVYEINRQQGVIDSNGKEMLDRMYSFVELHDNNEAQVFDGEHWKTIPLKIK